MREAGACPGTTFLAFLEAISRSVGGFNNEDRSQSETTLLVDPPLARDIPKPVGEALYTNGGCTRADPDNACG
jgi:hypothetical protein